MTEETGSGRESWRDAIIRWGRNIGRERSLIDRSGLPPLIFNDTQLNRLPEESVNHPYLEEIRRNYGRRDAYPWSGLLFIQRFERSFDIPFPSPAAEAA